MVNFIYKSIIATILIDMHIAKVKTEGTTCAADLCDVYTIYMYIQAMWHAPLFADAQICLFFFQFYSSPYLHTSLCQNINMFWNNYTITEREVCKLFFLLKWLTGQRLEQVYESFNIKLLFGCIAHPRPRYREDNHTTLA